jgi:hypothetical protein
MPQDDYSSSANLDKFIVEHDVQYVFSPLTRDLEMIYPRSIKSGTHFHEAFTGYWESETVLPYASFRRDFHARTIDLGQRVRHLPPQFGPAAQKKGELALRFADAAALDGFKCDVSTKDSDVLLGDDWWRFLGNIKFTVGRLGGASIVDSDGKLAMKVNQLQIRNPNISFDAIAKKLSTSEINQGDFSAISPRLFECASMGVCQILERDYYFENFEPWIDYIPLEPDLSNLSDVFTAMRDSEMSAEIASHAEATLIASGKYSYSEFVKRLVEVTLGVDLDTSKNTVLHDHDLLLFGGLRYSEIEDVKRRVISTFLKGRFLRSSSQSEIEALWLDFFRQKGLIIESLTLPWCSALDNLGRS